MGSEIPRRGSGTLAFAGRLALRLGGWRFAGEIPNEPKLIFIVAPHTSNWDFVLGILAVFALDIRASFLGKHTLFRGPMGVLMRWLGGMPVVRHARQNVVDQTVGLIRSAPKIALGLSPEGTRRKLPRWRTGFYYVARGADVPIVPVALDYGARTIRFYDAHRTTPSIDADLAKLGALFSPGMARHPSQY